MPGRNSVETGPRFCDFEPLNEQEMLVLTQEMRQFEWICLSGSPGNLSARIFTTEEELEFEGHPINVTGVNYLVRSATTMMTGLVVLLFTLSSLLQLLLSSVAFPL